MCIYINKQIVTKTTLLFLTKFFYSNLSLSFPFLALSLFLQNFQASLPCLPLLLSSTSSPPLLHILLFGYFSSLKWLDHLSLSASLSLSFQIFLYYFANDFFTSLRFFLLCILLFYCGFVILVF